MQAIYIPRLLKAKEKTEEIVIDEFISNLETLTPVRGRIKVRHGGNFLEVIAAAETIITLSCDRCLQQYNHRLTLETSELIWLEANIDEVANQAQEREITLDDLSETLPPNGYFSPSEWLYEQLCLAMPMQKLCGKDCQNPCLDNPQQEQIIDSRWASLAALKNQLQYIDLEKE